MKFILFALFIAGISAAPQLGGLTKPLSQVPQTVQKQTPPVQDTLAQVQKQAQNQAATVPPTLEQKAGELQGQVSQQVSEVQQAAEKAQADLVQKAGSATALPEVNTGLPSLDVSTNLPDVTGKAAEALESASSAAASVNLPTVPSTDVTVPPVADGLGSTVAGLTSAPN